MDKVEEVTERFALLPVRSTFTKRLIWFKNYVELNIFYDDMGRPPVKDKSWKLIYTADEYTYYCLRK